MQQRLLHLLRPTQPSCASTTLPAAAHPIPASATDYGYITLTKRLNIIGSGYHLAESTPNPKTQANTASSTIGSLTFGKGSKGSVVQGFTLGAVTINDSTITVQRNKITSAVIIGSNSPVAFDTLRNNYFHAYLSCNGTSNTVNGLMIYNNIFTYTYILEVTSPNINLASGYFINNSFPGGTNSFKCVGFVFQNNIFGNSPDFSGYAASNSFFNNITSSATGIPSGNGNIRGVNGSSIYLSSSTPASSDGRFQLASGSPAAGAGLMNGTAVDCGAFGGPAPYILSGMPAIPSIYSLTAPTQVSQGATSINITFSTAAR